MRDIIWTLIVVWLVYKLVEIFKTSTIRKSAAANPTNNMDAPKTAPKKDLHSAIQKHMNQEGEYVDFEEIK
jgi:hypothetical protein